MTGFVERLAQIEEKIERACQRSGRKRSDVAVIAVSKSRSLEAMWRAYDAGCRVFGESRLQEALPKIEAMPSTCEWHFIGKLQSNKSRRAAETFSVLHTLESESQLREIAKQDRHVDGLIEVNVAGEAQKSGIAPADLESFVDAVRRCDRINLRGLMTIGPAVIDEERVRSVFRDLRRLSCVVGNPWLSMGMSQDYELAIEEGATHIRLGSAIFDTDQA